MTHEHGTPSLKNNQHIFLEIPSRICCSAFHPKGTFPSGKMRRQKSTLPPKNGALPKCQWRWRQCLIFCCRHSIFYALFCCFLCCFSLTNANAKLFAQISSDKSPFRLHKSPIF